MSVNQDNLNELRFLRKQNLLSESKIVSDWYRDLLRSYGVDCKYYKLKTNFPENFKTSLTKNNITRVAYSEEPEPVYAVAANMITYMDVGSDVLQLNNLGLMPSTTVTFYFNSLDFAYALAPQLGQYKEFQVHNNDIKIEFSEQELLENNGIFEVTLPFDTDVVSGNCTFTVDLTDYVNGTVTTEQKKKHKIYAEKSKITFEEFKQSNEFLYNSPSLPTHPYYSQQKDINDAIEDIALHFDYTVSKEVILKEEETEDNDNTATDDTLESGNSEDEEIEDIPEQDNEETPEGQEILYIISGKIRGSVITYDIFSLSKYSDILHPDAGDIVSVNFPGQTEQYQITEATDINISTDGLNPLMHKYIWRCSAIKHVSNALINSPEPVMADKRIHEINDFENASSEIIARKLSEYPNNEDDIYGGYRRESDKTDMNKVDLVKIDSTLSSSLSSSTSKDETNQIDKNTFINANETYSDIFVFDNGASLKTDGFILVFSDTDGKMTNLTVPKDDTDKIPPESISLIYKSPDDIEFMKATDECIVFMNILGEVNVLCDCFDMSNKLETTNKASLEYETRSEELKENRQNLTSLSETTAYKNNHININSENDCYFKFSNCRTVLFCIGNDLFCKLGYSKLLYKLT